MPSRPHHLAADTPATTLTRARILNSGSRNLGCRYSVGIVTDAFCRKRMVDPIGPEEAMDAAAGLVAWEMGPLAPIEMISERALDDLWGSEEVRP